MGSYGSFASSRWLLVNSCLFLFRRLNASCLVAPAYLIKPGQAPLWPAFNIFIAGVRPQAREKDRLSPGVLQCHSAKMTQGCPTMSLTLTAPRPSTQMFSLRPRSSGPSNIKKLPRQISNLHSHDHSRLPISTAPYFDLTARVHDNRIDLPVVIILNY